MRYCAAALVTLMACDGKGGDGPSPDLLLTTANNYSFEADFDFGEIEVQAGEDATVDWSAMTTDIRGRPMDPAALDQVLFTEFVATEDEVIDLILSNSVGMSDANSIWVWSNPGQTSVTLNGNLDAAGTLFDAATHMPEDPAVVWVMTILNVPNGSNDVLSSKFVVPRTTSTNSEIVFTDDCTTIDVEADLHSAEPLRTGEGIGPYTLDWTGLTEDVNGAAWDVLVGDNLVIAHFDAADIAEVEAEFVRLDVVATEYYQLDVFGLSQAILNDAQAADGTTFSGFTADGIWLVGITCRTCISPLPLAMAVVEVE